MGFVQNYNGIQKRVLFWRFGVGFVIQLIAEGVQKRGVIMRRPVFKVCHSHEGTHFIQIRSLTHFLIDFHVAYQSNPDLTFAMR